MAVPSIINSLVVVNMLHDNKYRLSWAASSVGEVVTQYNIYRSNSAYGTFTKITQVGVETTICFDATPLDYGNFAFYKVTAVNATGESSLTNTNAVTDITVSSYMYVPEKLNIKYYDHDHQAEWKYNIIPNGIVNTTNKNFYFDYNYKEGSLVVFKNGYKLSEGYFTETGSNTFALSISTTTTVGDVIDCNLVRS